MLIRTSSYIHLTKLGPDRVLILHAVSHLRLVVDQEVASIVDWFKAPRDMPGELSAAPTLTAADDGALAGCLATLMERGVLTDQDADQEASDIAERLAQLHGRDPGEALDRLRRESKRGADPYWSITESLTAEGLARRFDHVWDVLLFGDCELQMEADFLRQAAAARGVELSVATGFPNDLRLAAERPHRAILVGALRSRRAVALARGSDFQGEPYGVYIEEARRIIEGLRRFSHAPILIDNLPEPTVSALGLAERGPNSHRNRFRRLNLALESLCADFADVHVIDIAAALNGEGSRRLVDDALVGFTHFGSPGWLLQRPKSELAAVHGLFPDMALLAASLDNDAYRRERITAKLHMDVLSVLAGLDRKKCVIVDLDGTLWPGVLAETGSPFAWTPEVSGTYSYAGYFFGLHEALLALKKRGVLLACVSKNDEAVVRALWRYDDHYPRERLLTLEDFVTVRINWDDKPTNIRSIAHELGFALEAFAFIDDHPVERGRVRAELPEVVVLGDDPFEVRRTLLNDPMFQVLRVTEEASVRTELVKSQLQRERLKSVSADAGEFVEALDLVCRFEQPRQGPVLDRVLELLTRTTQFNTTAWRPTANVLLDHAGKGDLHVCYAQDRFGDYGLVAVAVVSDGEIIAFVMSCRVIGLGVDRRFLSFLVEELAESLNEIRGRIIETSRNGPVRHLYLDNGFSAHAGIWRRSLSERRMAG